MSRSLLMPFNSFRLAAGLVPLFVRRTSPPSKHEVKEHQRLRLVRHPQVVRVGNYVKTRSDFTQVGIHARPSAA